MKPELMVDAPIFGPRQIWVKKVNKPYFDHPYHFHKLCELTWVEKSHGKLIIGDYVGNYYEGELILASPELPHLWKSDPVYYMNKENLFTRATGLYFPMELVSFISDDSASLVQYNLLMQRAERGLRFYDQTRLLIIEKIRELQECSGLLQLGIFLQIIAILSSSKEYEFLSSVGYKKSTDTNEFNRFNEVYGFLMNNFQRDIMLEEVAAVCNMAPNSFCRYFKSKTQKTFTYFLNEIRVGHAKKLLQNENIPIKDICYECGFNNPVHFFTCFKQLTRQTPRSFRETIRKINMEC